MRVALGVLLLTIPGCLSPPVLPPRPDSGLHDASLPPFAMIGVEVLDARGRGWPPSAAPRSASIRVTFTSPPADPSLVLLLDGDADADLAGDLDTTPYRATTLARAVPVETAVHESTLTLTPIAPLASGAHVTLALPRWLEDAEGHRLDAALTQTIVISSGADAGAKATDAWPPDGAFEVAPALALAAIRFDGALEDPAHAVTLARLGGGFVVASTVVTPCATIGWADGVCVELVPLAALAPDADYLLAVATDTRDATGARMPAFSARFHTAPGATTPLGWSASVCAIGEDSVENGCARADDESVGFRGQLTGAARLAWSAADAHGATITPRGTVALRVGMLAPTTPTSLMLDAVDYAGATTTLRLPLATTEPLATLSITEVRADPGGPEPRQEYVEIENYGATAVSLGGLFLADAPTAMGDALPNVSIPAGARALLVATGFDPDDAADITTPAGTLLVRLDASLASGGLSNAGEPLFLRDAMNRWISAAPSAPPPREGVCIVRAIASHRVGDPGSFRYDPALTCTPGR